MKYQNWNFGKMIIFRKVFLDIDSSFIIFNFYYFMIFYTISVIQKIKMIKKFKVNPIIKKNKLINLIVIKI